MYISKIQIKGFRNYKDHEILFRDGINVIIGHNNAGKSNLIKALSLVIDYQSNKRLVLDDFNKDVSIDQLKSIPPQVTISITITQSENEDLNSDDLVTVGNFLTKLEPPYEAMLTYVFFLPEAEKQTYINALKDVQDANNVWKIIKTDFLRLCTHRIFAGDAILQITADSDSLQKFDFQFLNAIRDVERDMLTGRNTLLRDVLDFFMDYEIKNDKTKTEIEKHDEIKKKRIDFETDANILLGKLQGRMEKGKKEILAYAEETGASFNKANPDFDGSISDVEMFSALRLIVEYETGIKIPATHNGLGYNNLIFISLLLAKMQVDSDGNYLGSNAKVFPILAIEEPEAHLHPAMQYKFLKFLRENKDVKKKVRQLFITTHSTHITSAVSLDEIICLHSAKNGLTIGYPGKVFANDDAGKKSKAYVQRFLDATKSDMLFAQKVILVEGIAEQLTLSSFVKCSGKSLEDNHIAVINVGGRYFEHFLKLFDTLNPNTIPKMVACITDRDPEMKNKKDSTFKKCYPFEYKQDMTNNDYQDNASSKISKYTTHPNIRFFSQDENTGKTFEYDLLLHNPSLDLLITETLKNKDEIRELMLFYKENKQLPDFVDSLRKSIENERIFNGIIANTSWGDDDKKKAIIAARYLNSVEKGENSLELSLSLEQNQANEKPEQFVIPTYIKNAVEWICQ